MDTYTIHTYQRATSKVEVRNFVLNVPSYSMTLSKAKMTLDMPKTQVFDVSSSKLRTINIKIVAIQ